MMRTLMVVALAALTVMAVAQDEPEEVQRHEVALDVRGLAEGVEGLADLLEKKLSGPARGYYEVVLAKNRMYGIVGVISGAVFFLLGVYLILRAFRANRRIDEEVCGGEVAAYALAGVFLVVAGGAVFGARVGFLLAPEYYAMQEFIETASQFMP